MENIIETTIQHGFSIAVAVFLLLRTDKHLQELRDAVLRLANVFEAKGSK